MPLKSARSLPQDWRRCSSSPKEIPHVLESNQCKWPTNFDAGRCGLTAINEHGDHWIAGNLRLDLASLNKVEMLPWDVWGGGWAPGERPTDAQLQLFDEAAGLTVEPDARFAELRHRYETDDALRMDGTVFNVLRGQPETV